MGTSVLVSLMVMACVAGCNDEMREGRINAPPQGQPVKQHPIAENFTAMTDNAMLNDGTMSEAHFVPRSSELNALGVRRLSRMMEMLRVYGGKLFYDGTEEDAALRKARIARIESFLVACGLERSAFSVEEGFADSAGMDATEAIAIRQATRGPGDTTISDGMNGGAGAAAGAGAK